MKMVALKILLAATCVLATLHSVQPAKILLLPTPTVGSHVNFFSLLGAELKAHGHEVTVVVTEKNSVLATKVGVKVIQHNVTSDADKQRFQEIKELHKDAEKIPSSPMAAFSQQASFLTDVVEFMFQDDEFMSQLEQGKFDMAIVDGLDFARLMYLIPYRFNIRYMTLTARHDPWIAGVPAMPSVEPFFANAAIPTDLQSFTRRTVNTLMYLASYYFINNIFDNNLISKWVPNKPRTTFTELVQKSEIFLCNLDTMCLEPPLTSAPNYLFFYGLALSPAQQLPEELNNFVQGSGDAGVIVVSFGSVIEHMPEHTQLAFFNTFRQIPQRVVMKKTGELSEKAKKLVSSNVLLQKWMPQNDLLGHPKVKLFITHGGNNGQQEAVYHGIPMITMPCNGDQFHNAKRVEDRGYGKTLDMKSFTEEDLLPTIRDLLENSKYAAKIKHCSAAIHSLVHPREAAVLWIEHVLKHGGEHLRPPGLGVPLYQWFMVDIIAVFVITVLIIMWLLLSLIRFLCTKSARSTTVGPKEQKNVPKRAKKE